MTLFQNANVERKTNTGPFCIFRRRAGTYIKVVNEKKRIQSLGISQRDCNLSHHFSTCDGNKLSSLMETKRSGNFQTNQS